jgi:hypothetical protein
LPGRQLNAYNPAWRRGLAPPQTEIGELRGERERLRGAAADAEARVAQLTGDVEAAKQVSEAPPWAEGG